MLEIGLVVLGLIIIGISYVISERVEVNLQEKAEGTSSKVKDLWTEKEEKIVRERIDSIMEERVGLAIDKTEDELSRISNEKIMSSNEFSEQVLGKIEQNHEEVVFLYNMLNEKEKQMKTLMQEIETFKTATEDSIIEQKEAASEKSQTAVDMLEKMNKTEKMAAASTYTNAEERDIFKLREFAKSIEEDEDNTADTQGELISEKMTEQNPESGYEKNEGQSEKASGNRNEEILRLYKKGMTVLEISKVLDMGQGEVQLVVNLFQGAK